MNIEAASLMNNIALISRKSGWNKRNKVKGVEQEMLVKYIGDYYKASLLKGKDYEVIEDKTMEDFYKTVDETGEWFYFPKQLFEVVVK